MLVVRGKVEYDGVGIINALALQERCGSKYLAFVLCTQNSLAAELERLWVVQKEKGLGCGLGLELGFALGLG